MVECEIFSENEKKLKKMNTLLTTLLRREEDDLRDFEEMRARVMVMVFSIFRSFVIFVVIICLG